MKAKGWNDFNELFNLTKSSSNETMQKHMANYVDYRKVLAYEDRNHQLERLATVAELLGKQLVKLMERSLR